MELQKFVKQLKRGSINIEEISNMNFSESVTNWSEGIERNIRIIKMHSSMEGTDIHKELQRIGEEQGFKIEFINNSDNQWIEDSSIRRHDGKIYVSNHSNPNGFEQPLGEYMSKRGNASAIGQGSVIRKGYGFDLIKREDRHYGTSYLEGGNVLNTISADGTPAAIVGETSIGMTLELLSLENTPENVELVKKYIAEDLGLSVEQVTFIPQHEFHIDMIYRPLQNGKIAIPDYEEGIKHLTNLYNQKSAEFDQLEQDPSVSAQKREQKRDSIFELAEKIEELKKVAKKTQSIREEANDYLKDSGYELVKIPCFSTRDSDCTNFMNGVGGTSAKTGQTFYITNKSEYTELQDVVEEYFKQAGIDNVYFVSTTELLRKKGGIDCLTQEM